MKVLLINSMDIGGAANACLRLHQGLLNEGIASKVLLKKKLKKNIPETYKFLHSERNLKKRAFNKIQGLFKKSNKNSISQTERTEFLESRSCKLEIFNFPFSDINITESGLYKEADVINLHWVAGFLDFPSFFKKNKKPIVWTLHDAFPFLGGEHYSERFNEIDDQGYPVPRIYSKQELRITEKILESKKLIFKNVSKLHVVCPSQWLKKESEHSSIFKKYPHYTIPYGVPIEVFKPLDKNFCRNVFNLSKDKIIILFVSESLNNFRKGYVFLKRSIDCLTPEYQDQVLLVGIGGGSKLNIQSNSLELGPILDERLMPLVYSAADLFVIPSLEDNLPNTMIESLLCGTPVIGFPNGGISETIVDSFNGYLCLETSVFGLKQTIEKSIKNIRDFDRIVISKSASELFNLTRQARSYSSLFQKVLQEV